MRGVDLGGTPGAANVGDKAMTLVHSALAGGEWIGDADRLRAGATGQVLGHRVAAPSTLGTGAGSGPWPLTIDVDSTHCQTYGLHKQGAVGVDRHGERGYHPAVAMAPAPAHPLALGAPVPAGTGPATLCAVPHLTATGHDRHPTQPTRVGGSLPPRRPQRSSAPAAAPGPRNTRGG